MISKPILVPLKVPWRIKFEESQFELLVRHQGMFSLKFQAEYLPPKLEADGELYWLATDIEMQFEAGWSRTSLDWDSTKYAWHLVFPNTMLKLLNKKHHVTNLEAFSSEFKIWEKKWVQNQICDNPMIYEARNSDWLNDSDLGGWGYHYLFQLEDMTIEIISRLGYWKKVESKEWNLLEFGS
jgi:hypothetical protein